MPFKIVNLKSWDRPGWDKALKYLKENPHPAIRQRPEDELERALETGQCFMVMEDGQVHGVSFIYKFEAQPTQVVYSEIGTQRVTSNGYGLQSFLAKLHFLQIWLEEFDKGAWPAVFAVVAEESGSAHVLTTKVRMTQWEPPDELRVARGRAGIPFTSKKPVLLAGRDSFVLGQADLRDLYLSRCLFRTPGGGATVELQLGWFTPALLEVDMTDPDDID